MDEDDVGVEDNDQKDAVNEVPGRERGPTFILKDWQQMYATLLLQMKDHFYFDCD